jgi:hypothetical protein
LICEALAVKDDRRNRRVIATNSVPVVESSTMQDTSSNVVHMDEVTDELTSTQISTGTIM